MRVARTGARLPEAVIIVKSLLSHSLSDMCRVSVSEAKTISRAVVSIGSTSSPISRFHPPSSSLPSRNTATGSTFVWSTSSPWHGNAAETAPAIVVAASRILKNFIAFFQNIRIRNSINLSIMWHYRQPTIRQQTFRHHIYKTHKIPDCYTKPKKNSPPPPSHLHSPLPHILSSCWIKEN